MRAPHITSAPDKRKILSKKDLMREVYACKECDCEKYPWCVYMGGLCKSCVDLNTYTHKMPLRNCPGEYSTPRDTKNRESKIEYPHLEIIKTELNGDCLYSAISLAFEGKISVNDLRYLVAHHQTPETYETYKDLASFMPEYLPIKAAHSLRDFRVLIKKTGDDVGVQHCVWGDENALQIISTFLRLGIKIFNEKGQYIQQIVPERTNSFNNTTPTRYVLLLLNSSKPANEHYNLLKFNKHTLLTHDEWDKMKSILSRQ